MGVNYNHCTVLQSCKKLLTNFIYLFLFYLFIYLKDFFKLLLLFLKIIYLFIYLSILFNLEAMFYLRIHSTHFIYDYVAPNIW